MSRAWRAAAVAVTVAALAGCGFHGTGTIVGKADIPSHYGETMMCAGYGKYGCRIWMPLSVFVPEAWEFNVRDSNGHDHTVRVPEAEYNGYDVGESVTVK